MFEGAAMLMNQLKVEFRRALTKKRIVIWVTIIFLPIFIKFYMIKEGYTFYRPVELFQELISGFVPMLFPLFMLLVYANNFVLEEKNHFSLYTRTRIWFPTYIISKALVNGILAFLVSFIMIFLPFVFSVYIEPIFSIINYYDLREGESFSNLSFDQYLRYGTLVYGLIYAFWVALNGLIYASITFLLPFFIRNWFVAFSIPFVGYHVMNFISGVFGYAKFSPISTIFPFNVIQQEIWTVFVPFFILISIWIGMIIILKRRKEWDN
jgi:hypothetical protein